MCAQVRLLILPCLLALCQMTTADTRLQIEQQVELSWPTSLGKIYQLQGAVASGAAWTNLGTQISGDGSVHSWVDSFPSGNRTYQVLEIIPGTDPSPVVPVNGGFEIENGAAPANWSTTGSQPPVRNASAAHSGLLGMRSALVNVGANAAEGGLSQNIATQGGSITSGKTYDFSFWAKQVTAGPSYVQQYQVQWLSASNEFLGGSGLINFNGTIGSWVKIVKNGLLAPARTATALVSFRFVTGAIQGGHGEVLVDDVLLDSGGLNTVGSPEVIRSLSLTAHPLAKLSWDTYPGNFYQAVSSRDLQTWMEVSPVITGDGSLHQIKVPMTNTAEFFRLVMPAAPILAPTNLHVVPANTPNAIRLAWDSSASSGISGYRIHYRVEGSSTEQSLDLGLVTTALISGLTPGANYQVSVVALGTGGGESPAGGATLSAQPEVDYGIVALFNSTTALEAEVSYETPTARITRFADRARDRHAREAQFNSYDHYLSWYWEQRVANIEIIDRVAKGGTGITFNFTTDAPLNPAEFRAFYRGITTVAEYHHNVIATFVSSSPSSTPGENAYLYTATLTSKLPENRALLAGDRVEVEISQFLLGPRNGRSNYYGTTFLYVVGQGIVPWYGSGSLLDSFPLPQTAWLGGLTTLPYQYSNEPEHRFKQTAGNISPTNGHAFMVGRRLHHTDFSTGAHTEPDNPLFTAQAGKLGPKFVAQSCVECHVNNGRSLPPAIGVPLLQAVVKVGTDANGSTHPLLGGELQPKSVSGANEGNAKIAGYTITGGTYADGTAYSLRKPNYTFDGVTPAFFSVRVAPQLVGLGLLEAIDEKAILAMADPNDSNGDGVSGRVAAVIDPETGISRLGRFTYKAAQPKVIHQIAYALNKDMSVTTALFPILDGETAVRPAEISTTELDQMNRYVSLLGVAARRDLTNTEALRGEQLFQTASCTACHTPQLTTSPYHPMAELRNQTIRPFTDLLLHDMGPGLADNMGEDGAGGAEWRTAPLWSIGLTAGVSGGEAYLHDGRARTLEEAILWHGGEAERSKEVFRKLPTADRAALLKFLKSL
jgi:CxxC motif-containing protein (DUF1111 family)